AANQLGRQARQSIVIILRRAVFDRYILALDIAGVLEALTESAQTIHARVERIGIEASDHRHGRLLRTRGEWPRRRRTTEQRYELAAFCVEHGLPSRNPLCQLTAGSGCLGSARRSLGKT